MVKESDIPTMAVCGGALSLDFINTVSTWISDQGRDFLKEYHDFYLWTERLNVLHREEFAAFTKYSDQKKFNQPAAMKSIRSARRALYNIFNEIAARKQVSSASLNEWNRWMKKAQVHLVYTKRKAGEIQYTFQGNPLELIPLWYVLKQSEKLVLDNPLWNRIRSCPSCGWLFLDTSKGGKRRWCDMNVCGSRDKALRYYYNSK